MAAKSRFNHSAHAVAMEVMQGLRIMERTTFLEYYRIRAMHDGTPIELRRSGAAITYEAVDERSGEMVALTLFPIEGINPEVRQQLEDHARALQKLRHINIAKLMDFGREQENFVYISDYLQSTTLAAWVRQHGLMAADAVLRTAEQVLSVLASANFHKLTYPAIQPSNIIVVPGVTPEGTWPLIRLTDLGLPGFGDETGVAETREESVPVPPELAGAEPQRPPEYEKAVDFRSQIFSLGATMYFLLTGAPLSTQVRRGQLRGLAKPLRSLLSQMLRRNPEQRPTDPVALAEMVRECLLKIERRQKLASRLGIPLIAKIPRTRQRRPVSLQRIALATSAVIVAAAVVALFLFPERISAIWRHYRGPKPIGVLVGVPESSPARAAQNTSTPMIPEMAPSEAAKSAFALGQQSQPQPDRSSATDSTQAASPDAQQDQTASAQPEGTANPATSPDETASTSAATVENSAQANATPQPTGNSQTGSRSEKKRVASVSRGLAGSRRAHMIGITSDGRLIYRLPSGRTRIVAPDADEEEFIPRRHRRAFIDRGDRFMPLQPFEPGYPPYD